MSTSFASTANEERFDYDSWVKKEREKREHILDKRGVNQVVVIGGHDYLRPRGIEDTRVLNDRLTAYREVWGSRVLSTVGIVEPLFGEAGFEELTRCKTQLGMSGISFHARFQGVSMESIWVRRYIEKMGELGLVPFLHAVGESPEEALWKLEELGADFPDLTFIILDAFSTFEQSRFARIVARRRPNFTFDTGLARGISMILPVINECGAERIVYGSDLYSWPQPAHDDTLEDIRSCRLSEGDKSLILGQNIQRILQSSQP
jgi:hypothetical protein